ncbi:MAG TPA: acyltransferase family protein [Candidatus Levybacteria bacterium]|nr:acyltransferase family protein [Candidatus Levybacteria bacterium]
MKQRVGWIDIARGIGILAVLYGHAVSGDSYRHIVYAFHMPLFFFLSGIVFRPQKYREFFPFLWKNVVTILFPYFLFAFLSYLIWLSARTTMPSVESITQHFLNVLYGNSSGLFFNVVLWFLPCLFVTKLLFWIITRVSLNSKYILATLILLSAGGYIFSILYPGIKLPFGLETALNATVFFGMGYLWQAHTQKISSPLQKYAIPTFFILTLLMIGLAQTNFNLYGYQIDMRLNRYSNYFLYYGAALSGIFAVVIVSLKLKSNRMLEHIGKQSLPLFVWHIIVFTYLTQFLRSFLSPETISTYRNLYIAPIFTIVATILILLGMYVYKRITQRFSL